MRRRRPTFDEIQAAKKADAQARSAARDQQITDVLREHATTDPVSVMQLAQLTGLPTVRLQQRLERLERLSGPGPLLLTPGHWVWVE